MKLTRRDILALVLGGVILLLSLTITSEVHSSITVYCHTYEKYSNPENLRKYFDPDPYKQIEIFKDEHGRGFVSATYDEETDTLTECFNPKSEKQHITDLIREKRHD
ncbi:MAG: hypothetical protein ACR2LL_05835 [Nitrosopumilus sp.]